MLAAIADLELVARVTVDGTISGLHRSPFHGYSAEFSQYRQYRPGDDLKYVDWKLFARTDRLYTKQYRETTNMVAQIAIDASAVDGVQRPRRRLEDRTTRACWRGGARVPGVERRVTPSAFCHSTSGCARTCRRAPVRRTCERVLLALVGAGGVRDDVGVAAPLRRAVDLMRRRGLLVLISDLYDEDEQVEAELKRASRIGHEVALFHVLTRDEIDVPVRRRGRARGPRVARRTAMSGASTAPRTDDEFAGFLARWRTRCASHGFTYTQVTTDRRSTRRFAATC